MILPSRNLGRCFDSPTASDSVLLRAGIAVEPLFQCAFLGTTGRLVAAGLGITALPRPTLALTAAPGLPEDPEGGNEPRVTVGASRPAVGAMIFLQWWVDESSRSALFRDRRVRG